MKKTPEIQMLVAMLKEQKDMSFADIARQLKMQSRQLARYHYDKWLKDKDLSTGELDKDK